MKQFTEGSNSCHAKAYGALLGVLATASGVRRAGRNRPRPTPFVENATPSGAWQAHRSGLYSPEDEVAQPRQDVRKIMRITSAGVLQVPFLDLDHEEGSEFPGRAIR